jgi:RND family efflux transporter MFP subunit
MQNRKTLLTGIAAGAIVTALVLAATGQISVPGFGHATEASASTGEAPARPAPQVEVATAEASKITRWDEYTGRFQAVDEVAIRARVSGYLEQVHFTPGQIVEKGDLLFTIDPRPFEAALKQAEARTVEARTGVKLARNELERARKLVGEGHISQSVYDTRQQEYDAAVASVAAAEAAAENARLDLGFTEIVAPVTGRISDDAINPGNLIAAGSESNPLTTIVSLDPIHFVFDASEQQYLAYLRAGKGRNLRDVQAKTPVAVKLIDESEFSHGGHLDFLDNRLDRETGTIRGRAILGNPDGVLTPGMFGRLRLATNDAADAVLIPDYAVGSDQTRKYVWTVNADNEVSRRIVVLGERHLGQRIVESGLAAGERIVVSGLHMIADGIKIDPIDAPVDVAASQ